MASFLTLLLIGSPIIAFALPSTQVNLGTQLLYMFDQELTCVNQNLVKQHKIYITDFFELALQIRNITNYRE